MTALAQLCPICNGEGVIRKGAFSLRYKVANSNAETVTCHGCTGTGWVEVRRV